MRLVAQCIVAGASVTLLGLAVFHAARSRGVFAANEFIPRLVEIKEVSTDGQGKSIVTYLTNATRSDGSESVTSTIFSDNGQIVEKQRYLSLSVGMRVVADLVGNVKSSTKQSSSAFKHGLLTRRLDHTTDCVRTGRGEDIRTSTVGGMELLGFGEFGGFKVTKLRMQNPPIEMWHSPQLGCEIVHQVASYAVPNTTAIGTSTRTMIKAVLGEPDPELFQTPSDAKELSPSAFAISIASRCNRKVSVDSYAEEDRRYYQERP